METDRNEVTLSREQTEMHAVARDIEHWLKGLKVVFNRLCYLYLIVFEYYSYLIVLFVLVIFNRLAQGPQGRI